MLAELIQVDEIQLMAVLLKWNFQALKALQLLAMILNFLVESKLFVMELNFLEE